MLSFLNVYAPPIRSSATNGRTDSFSPSILPPSRNLFIPGNFNCHHPLWDRKCTLKILLVVQNFNIQFEQFGGTIWTSKLFTCNTLIHSRSFFLTQYCHWWERHEKLMAQTAFFKAILKCTFDVRGEEVFDWVISSDLFPLNDPDIPTFFHCFSSSRSSSDISSVFSSLALACSWGGGGCFRTRVLITYQFY